MNKGFIGLILASTALTGVGGQLCWADNGSGDNSVLELGAGESADKKLEWIDEFRHAALKGDCAEVRELLDKTGKQFPNVHFRESFHWLKSDNNSEKCDAAMYQELIDLGADPNMVLEPGLTPLARAIAHQNIGLALFLLRYGVSVAAPLDPSGRHCIVCAAGPSRYYSNDENETRCSFLNEWFDRGGEVSMNARSNSSRSLALGFAQSCSYISPAALEVLDDDSIAYMHKNAVREKNVLLLGQLNELGIGSGK